MLMSGGLGGAPGKGEIEDLLAEEKKDAAKRAHRTSCNKGRKKKRSKNKRAKQSRKKNR